MLQVTRKLCLGTRDTGLLCRGMVVGPLPPPAPIADVGGTWGSPSSSLLLSIYENVTVMWIFKIFR